jgi:hypothetical protein
MKNNIWVTNYSGIDLNDATRYLEGDGEIIYITDGKQNIFATDSLVRDIRYTLKNYQHGDFLLIAGNSVIAALCMAEVRSKFNRINTLIWDHRKSEYQLRIWEGEKTNDKE